MLIPAALSLLATSLVAQALPTQKVFGSSDGSSEVAALLDAYAGSVEGPYRSTFSVVLAIALADSSSSVLFALWFSDTVRAASGFDLDLNAMRLVQFGEDEPAIWINERQKIIEKAKGRKFMDM